MNANIYIRSIYICVFERVKMMTRFIERIRLNKSSMSDSDYVSSLMITRLLSDIEDLMLPSPVTFFVGENGSGKSTLLEAIAVQAGFNPEGGTKNFSFSTHETHSELYKHITLVRGTIRPKDGFFFRSESFYNVATEIDRLDQIQPLLRSYGGKSLHEQSHGESFFSLFNNRFGGKGLYILDEPESALSPSRQMSLLVTMNNLVKSGSQFIIATHSPVLLAFPRASIYVIEETGINLTAYENTEPYTLTKDFLNNTPRMLKYLLEDDEAE